MTLRACAHMARCRFDWQNLLRNADRFTMGLVRRMARAFFAAGIAVILAAASRAHGQADLERFNRQLEQIQRETLIQADRSLSLDQRAFFDYGGYATFGYLSADDNVNDNHVLRQSELVGYARLNLDGAHEFFLSGRWGWRDFNEGDSFDGRGDEPIDGELDRWYYRFDLQRYQAAYYGRKIDYNVVIKGGRDLNRWRNGLFLSTDLEGLNATFSWGGNDLTAIAGVTPVRTVDFDSSRPAFDHNTRRGFYGAMLSRNVANHRPYVYGLIQRDYNEHDTLITGPVTTKYDYDSYYLGVGSTGPIGDRMLYGVEAVYEGGHGLSNSVDVTTGLAPLPQTREQIRAFAGDARLDYLLNDARHTRFTGEVIIASGDDDRLLSSTNTFGGNKSGTKDRAFNAFGLLNTGLAFAPAVSNMLAFRLGGSTFPLPEYGALRRMQVGSDVFLFNKLEADAPFDEPSFHQRYLGWEPDFFLNWQVTSDLTLVFRYGIFFPSSDAFTSDDSRQYIYGGVTYAF